MRPTDAAQRQSSPSVDAFAADRRRVVWICRVLAVFATVPACISAGEQDSLTALAFGVLGFGIAGVLLIVYPGDQEWISSLVFGIVGVVMMKVLFQSVGISW